MMFGYAKKRKTHTTIYKCQNSTEIVLYLVCIVNTTDCISSVQPRTFFFVILFNLKSLACVLEQKKSLAVVVEQKKSLAVVLEQRSILLVCLSKVSLLI